MSESEEAEVKGKGKGGDGSEKEWDCVRISVVGEAVSSLVLTYSNARW
jgi:hypothetical protein